MKQNDRIFESEDQEEKKEMEESENSKVYDLIYDEKPETLKVALDAYKEALADESAEALKEQIKSTCHYVIEPELTYTCFADAARNNSFNREHLQRYWEMRMNI